MENFYLINQFLQLDPGFSQKINQEIIQYFAYQIQNFQNNFGKLSLKTPEKHLLDNKTEIQYGTFSMPRLNLNNFSEGVLQIHKNNRSENNLVFLKDTGYSYKADFPYLGSDFSMKPISKNFNQKNKIFKTVEPKQRCIFLNNKRKNNNNFLDDGILMQSEKQDLQSKETNNNTISNSSYSKIIESNDNSINLDENQKIIPIYGSKPLFVVDKKNEKNVLKGRRSLKLNKRIHRASDDDNIMRKIQVHFLSFVINFLNDIIKTFSPVYNKDLFFKNIDYKIKKTVSHANVDSLKKKTIVQLLQLEISPKNKNYDKYTNYQTYLKVCEKLPFMKKFMDQGYSDMFNNYYFSSDKVFIVNGKLINLSERTEIFSDLINRNYPYKERIKYVAVNYFLFNYRKMKKHCAKLIKEH